MKVYALQRNGEIAVLDGQSVSNRTTADYLGQLLTANGLRWTPKILGHKGWLRTDESKSIPTDVVRVEAWDQPDPNGLSAAARAGLIYAWAASELELQAAAYAAAGGKVDDNLPTLAA